MAGTDFAEKARRGHSRAAPPVGEGFGRRNWVWAVLCLAVPACLVAAAGWAVYSAQRGAGLEREVERLAWAAGIQPGMSVAEIGAGGGRMAVSVARRLGPSGRLYATELGGPALERLRRAAAEAGAANLIVVMGAADSTGLAESCCDVIYMRRVYHHFNRPEAMNRALYAALKPGGRLAVLDFLSPRWLFFLKHGIPSAAVSAQVTAAGFTLERAIDHWSPIGYLLLFRKPAS